ncbi:hypothetical protein ACFV2H_37650 [Streptomyces sp. NPDC059629]|uniref:hypothetical protein n=1 Tax=Streptomyces sp. NPDC059629 TaxID=3346889 RepID=UPI0036971783
MAGSYEQALDIVAPSTATDMPDRDGVVNSDSWLEKWFGFWGATPHGWKSVHRPDDLDVWWWTDYVDNSDSGSGTHWTYVVGYRYNWAFFDDPKKAWDIFIRQSMNILSAFEGSPYENDDYSPNSVTFGVGVINGLTDLLQEWMPKFQSWADSIDAPDSDFKGSAAGVLKHHIRQFQYQLQAMHDQVGDPRLAPHLQWAADDMMWQAQKLTQAFDEWWADQSHSPYTLLKNQFDLIAASPRNLTLTGGDSGTDPVLQIVTPYGDPLQQGFWTQAEANAKQNWTASLSGLDSTAQTLISSLTTDFNTSATQLPTVIVGPPSPDSGNSGSGNDTGINPEDFSGIDPNSINPKDITGDGSGNGGINGDNFGITTGGSGGSGDGITAGGSGSGGTGAGGKNFSLPGGGLSNIGGGSGGDGITAGGSGSGLSDTVTGPDGKPILGSDGMPITVPAGSTIGSDGSVTGPNGKPVLGADGKPIKVPTGSRLTASGSGSGSGLSDTVTGPDGKPILGSDGMPITVPDGSKIGSDGSVTGPNGKPVLGSDGKPVKVPTGSRLTASDSGSGSGGHQITTTGGGSGSGLTDTVTGPDGKPILGSDGKPITVPDGSKIGSDGSVTGPNGKPVLGSDGKPVKVPADSRLTAGGSGYGSSSGSGGNQLTLIGSDGKPITVPAGSTIGSDGSVIGPNGKPLLGSNGKPLTVSGGSSSWQLGGSGKLGRQVLTNASSGGGLGSTLGRSTTVPNLSSEMSGLRAVGGGMGMSDRAKTLLNPEESVATPGNEGGAANEAQALEEAAQEEGMMSRVATVGGAGANEGSMIPPMAGGMGGMGGGNGSGPRKSWVTEDEETWGTTTAGTKGVIGR